MRSYRHLLALVAISICLVVAWIFATSGERPASLAAPAQPPVPSGRGAVIALEPAVVGFRPAFAAAVPRASSPVPVRASLARDNPYWVELDAPDRLAAFRRLSVIDDPAAVLMAHEIAMWCAKYADHHFARTLEEIEAQPTAQDAKAKRRALAARERSRCAGFESPEFETDSERYRALLAKQGPRTVGMGEPTGPEQFPQILASLREAATLQDPQAIENLAVFMLNVLSRRHATYDIGDGTEVTPRMMWAAFMLAACEYGRDCGVDNGMLVAQCVNAGRCDVSSVEEFFIRYRQDLRTGEPAAMLAARDMVLRGLRTGQWPRDLRVLAPATRP